MSDLFDDLARTLALPMPRRRAVRSIVAAVAVTALPALRPRNAGAQTVRATACPPRTKRCFVAIEHGTHEGGCYYPELERCCIGPNLSQDHPNQMSWTCGKNEGCGTAGLCVRACADGRSRCEKACCDRTETCVDGNCERCPETRECGTTCCDEGAVCRNRRTGLCCVKAWKQCTTDQGVVKCCPPAMTCCFDQRTKKYTCCDPDKSCIDGVCRCKKDEVRCGKTCCKKNEHCVATIASMRGKLCCTSRQIVVRPNGKPVCCPPGTAPNRDETGCCPPGNPGCCGGDDPLECLGNSLCVRGVCQNLG